MLTKPGRRARQESSSKRSRLLAEQRMVRTMNCWLDKISPSDIEKLWPDLEASVKAVKFPISLEIMANGTTKKAACPVVVTVCTMRNGFALRFTGAKPANPSTTKP